MAASTLFRHQPVSTDTAMDPLDNFMMTSAKSRRCDVDRIHVLKDMEPHMIYDSNTTATTTTTAALNKLKQLQEEKYKLLKKNLILELEVSQLEVQREKLLRKSQRREEKRTQLEEDNNEVKEKEKMHEERFRQLEVDLNAMMEKAQMMEAKSTQLKGSNTALLQMDDSLDVHIRQLEERKTAMCEKHQRREMVLIQMEEKTQALKDLCLSLRKNRKHSCFHFFTSPETGEMVMVEEKEGKGKKMQSLFTWIRKRLNTRRK